MTCTECSLSYHLQSCSGIADSTFNTMGPTKREKWRCKTCRSKESRSTAEGSSVASQLDLNTLSQQISAINRKLDLLSSLKNNVDALMQVPAKVDDLLSLKPSVDKMKKAVEEVEKSISFFSKKYDSLLATVTAHDKKVKSLESDVVSLQSLVSEQSLQIEHLKWDMNEAEQYSRLSNLEIHGHPSADGENLGEVLTELAGRLDISFQASEVLAIHRIPSKHSRSPPILVRFISVSVKERFMNARNRLRTLARDSSGPRLYFNDNLSRGNKELFWLARTRGKEKHYQFVWVRNAKIFAKKAEGCPLVRVNSVKDLERIV